MDALASAHAREGKGGAVAPVLIALAVSLARRVAGPRLLRPRTGKNGASERPSSRA